MSNLKSLKFVVVSKTENNPVQNRRRKMIQRLEEQKLLAQNPTHVRTVQKWTKKDGERVLVETKKRVRPWSRTEENGSLIFIVRNGLKVVEFENGKSGIAVPSQDKLTSVIDTLIDAVKQGELDELLARGTKPKAGKQRKAAA